MSQPLGHRRTIIILLYHMCMIHPAWYVITKRRDLNFDVVYIWKFLLYVRSTNGMACEILWYDINAYYFVIQMQTGYNLLHWILQAKIVVWKKVSVWYTISIDYRSWYLYEWPKNE